MLCYPVLYNMSCYAILFCIICHAMLSCSAPCCLMLFCVVLCYTVLVCFAVLFCAFTLSCVLIYYLPFYITHPLSQLSLLLQETNSSMIKWVLIYWSHRQNMKNAWMFYFDNIITLIMAIVFNTSYVRKYLLIISFQKESFILKRGRRRKKKCQKIFFTSCLHILAA